MPHYEEHTRCERLTKKTGGSESISVRNSEKKGAQSLGFKNTNDCAHFPNHCARAIFGQNTLSAQQLGEVAQ